MDKKRIIDETLHYLADGETLEEIAQAFISLNHIHSQTNQLAGLHPSDMTNPEVLRAYALALIVEVTEFLQEFNWKPWKKTDEPLNQIAAQKEFADIIAFVGVLITIMGANGFSPRRLAEVYIQVEKENVRRFTEGY